MPLIIVTNDNKKIIIENIEPYNKIKLLMSLISDNEDEILVNLNNENNENNDNINNNLINMSDNYEFELNASYFILNKIFEYSKYIYTIKDLNITEQDMYNYNEEFLDCKNEILCDLLNTADYLQYDDLIDIICNKIADDIQKCDSIETIKKKFNIKNIISKEEEEELLKNI